MRKVDKSTSWRIDDSNSSSSSNTLPLPPAPNPASLCFYPFFTLERFLSPSKCQQLQSNACKLCMIGLTLMKDRQTGRQTCLTRPLWMKTRTTLILILFRRANLSLFRKVCCFSGGQRSWPNPELSPNLSTSRIFSINLMFFPFHQMVFPLFVPLLSVPPPSSNKFSTKNNGGPVCSMLHFRILLYSSLFGHHHHHHHDYLLLFELVYLICWLNLLFRIFFFLFQHWRCLSFLSFFSSFAVLPCLSQKCLPVPAVGALLPDVMYISFFYCFFCCCLGPRLLATHARLIARLQTPPPPPPPSIATHRGCSQGASFPSSHMFTFQVHLLSFLFVVYWRATHTRLTSFFFSSIFPYLDFVHPFASFAVLHPHHHLLKTQT